MPLARLLAEAVGECVGSRLGTAVGIGLAEDVADVAADGVRADEEPLGDFGVAPAGSDEPEDLDFAFGEAVRVGRGWTIDY